MTHCSLIEFVLDGEIVSINDADPQMSVLTYCREVLQRTGTHEGCAEGDCGACTVVIAELNKTDEIVYKNVNACVLLLPMIDGKALFTAESLTNNNTLHPVQQALIDYHASQCGFCTPGVVMSLFALYKQNSKPSRDEVCYALSGNLCRCTGYRPIIEAAINMHKYDNNFSSDETLKKLLKQVNANSNQSTVIQHQQSTALLPANIQQLCDLKHSHPNAVIVAGNTDVGLWLNKHLAEIEEIIFISQIKELRVIKRESNSLCIGASVTLLDAFQAILEYYPSLENLSRRFASQPICQAGTLIGNIANGSPIGDSMPVLIALNSSITLRSIDGIREIALESFYLGYQQKDIKPNEFIQSVNIPINLAAEQLVASYKVSKRFDQDISAINMSFVVEIDERNTVKHCRIACGGMAAIPSRAKNLERALIGKQWELDTLESTQRALSIDFQPLDDLRASANYRLIVANNLLRRFVIETTQSDIPVSVYQMGSD